MEFHGDIGDHFTVLSCVVLEWNRCVNNYYWRRLCILSRQNSKSSDRAFWNADVDQGWKMVEDLEALL